MPDRHGKLLIGQDDRKGRARDIAFEAEPAKRAARQARLAGAEIPIKRDHVAGTQQLTESAPKRLGRLDTFEPHQCFRGSRTVTVVPCPGLDSNSTVPPCASMNCLASGRPRPSEESPPSLRWKRSNTRACSP